MEWLGTNPLSLVLSGLILALASYFVSLSLSLFISIARNMYTHTHVNCMQTWLRVSQKLHTTSQVVVGAIVGSVFSTLWYITWNSLVLQAFASSFSVQIAVFTVAAASALGSAVYVLVNWSKEDRWQVKCLNSIPFVSTLSELHSNHHPYHLKELRITNLNRLKSSLHCTIVSMNY